MWHPSLAVRAGRVGSVLTDKPVRPCSRPLSQRLGETQNRRGVVCEI